MNAVFNVGLNVGCAIVGLETMPAGVMPKIVRNRLTARSVASLKDGVFGDGGNLWLTVKGNTKAWSFRYKSPVTGKAREMGLGSAHDLSLAEARSRAAEARALLRSEADPLEQRRTDLAERRKVVGRLFEDVAAAYILERTPGWRDKRQPSIWTNSLRQHAYATIGRKSVAAIDTDDILSILRPIWQTKTETADRVRGRIERVLDYAATHGWRDGDNPARWRGHLSNILPPVSKVAKVVHFEALARQDIRPVVASLGVSRGLAAKAARFLCLTAARSGEVRMAVWSEIDTKAKVWTIPAERMKAGREHRVPLTDGAMAILEAVEPLRDPSHGDLVFPGQKAGKPLSDVALSKALHQAAETKDVTIHGLRSTFRDWAAEETDYPREVAEMALAHAIGDKVEAAYRRGDLFEKRRQMMEEWAAFCGE